MNMATKLLIGLLNIELEHCDTTENYILTAHDNDVQVKTGPFSRLIQETLAAAKRTEEEIREKFSELGYGFDYSSCGEIELTKREDGFTYMISIDFNNKNFSAATIYKGSVFPKHLTIEEFKLLSELFAIWGWN